MTHVNRSAGALLPVVAALLPAAACADDPPPGWSGKGQAGYVQARGNSDSDAANAALDVFLNRGDWLHALHVDGLYGKSAGVTSAERWDLRLQSNYAISSALYSFGAINYQDDWFSGFQYQVSLTGGIGYKFFNTERTRLSAQAGVGYRSLRPELLLKDNDGAVYARVLQDTQAEVVGVAGIDFEHDFNGTTKITDKLIAESGSNNTSVQNTLALLVKMTNKLSLAAAYNLIDNTSPPGNLKKLDTVTTLNVLYEFGSPKPVS
jgi:putative salt-induced outer membrane protein